MIPSRFDMIVASFAFVAPHNLMVAWARIISNVFEVIFAGITVRTLTHFIRNKNAGHKSLLRTIRGSAIAWAIFHGYWAFSVYLGTQKYQEYVVMMSAVLIGIVSVSIEKEARDIENTLETSEMASEELSAEAIEISRANDMLLANSRENKDKAIKLKRKIQQEIIEQHAPQGL